VKTICTIAILAALTASAHAEPILTKKQVGELGRVILSAKQNEKYREIFDCDKPSYDPKKHVWVFPGGFPVTPGGPVHVFELREKDGYYRLGSFTTHSFSPSPPKFRIAPAVRKKIRELLKSYAEERETKSG